MYKLKISNLYKEDTSSTYRFIKYKLEAPMAAENLKKEIKEKINKIKENPKFRPLVQDKYLASLGYRLVNVKNYMIFYIIGEDDKHLKIIRFLYNKRNWMNILKEKTVEEMM